MLHLSREYQQGRQACVTPSKNQATRPKNKYALVNRLMYCELCIFLWATRWGTSDGLLCDFLLLPLLIFVTYPPTSSENPIDRIRRMWMTEWNMTPKCNTSSYFAHPLCLMWMKRRNSEIKKPVNIKTFYQKVYFFSRAIGSKRSYDQPGLGFPSCAFSQE